MGTMEEIVNRPEVKQNPYISVNTRVPLRKIQSSYELKIDPPKTTHANMFPARKSNYLGHLRNRSFVNDIRLRFLSEDGNLAPKVLPRRSQSAPIFSSTALKTIHQKSNRESVSERMCKSAKSSTRFSSTPIDIHDSHISNSSNIHTVRRSLSARKFFGNSKKLQAHIYPETNGDFFRVQGVGIRTPGPNESSCKYLSFLEEGNSQERVNEKTKERTDCSSAPPDNVTLERLDYERHTEHLLQYYSQESEAIGLATCGTNYRSRTAIQNFCSTFPKATRKCTSSLSKYGPKRSEYYINLTKCDAKDEDHFKKRPFLVISKRAVLHEKSKEAKKLHNADDVIDERHKLCACSVCQSELNLGTSRLTLSPNLSKSPRDKKASKYWINPTGPVFGECYDSTSPNSPLLDNSQAEVISILD